jgi:RNA polymerase sigma factor (sigma-70 family)
MESSDHPPEPRRRNRVFATTHWSVVISAGRSSSPDSKQALEALCETYWYPLYAYARRQVPDVHEAHDLTQEFFSELLEKNYVDTATPERGRFRGFLLTAFKHFMSKQWEKSKTQRRGGGRTPISLDFVSADSKYNIEPSEGLTAEQFYDRQWAVTLLGKIMEQLEGEFDRDGKAKQFDLLKGYIVGDHVGVTYANVATELNMTEAAVKMSASRMRRRYRELLREEIGQTVDAPEEVDQEIRNLLATLEL